MAYKKQPSIRSRAMTAAHIIHKAGLGFTFSRCLSQAYAALRLDGDFALTLHGWLSACISRADRALSLTSKVFWGICTKVDDVYFRLRAV